MSGIPGYLDPLPTKIVCVGKNYADHARELGSELPAEPLIFLKPVSTLIGDGEAIELPPGAGRVDFEGEVAVQIGKRATRIMEDEALGYVSGVLPLNDVTARDLQNRDGQWTRAKGFDTFCPVGEPVPAGMVDLESLRIRTSLNGEVRQDALLGEAVFQVPALIAWISRIMTLEPGDIIATGTPSGIGPIVPWDDVEVTVEGVGAVRNPVRPAPGEPWPYEFQKG